MACFQSSSAYTIYGDDEPETFLEPMYPGSDDDLGFSDEETE